MKIQISSIDMEKQVFYSFLKASKECGINLGSLKYAIKYNKPSIKRQEDKNIFFIENIGGGSKEEEYKIVINGEKFESIKAAAEFFNIIGSTLY